MIAKLRAVDYRNGSYHRAGIMLINLDEVSSVTEEQDAITSFGDGAWTMYRITMKNGEKLYSDSGIFAVLEAAKENE